MSFYAQNGIFEIEDVKAGIYSAISEAAEPHANTRKKVVVAKAEKQATDISEVKLQSK